MQCGSPTPIYFAQNHEQRGGAGYAELENGDLLLLYTDGVTEALNLQNQEFGRERLTELSRQVNTLPVKEIVQEIRQALEEFSEGKPLADDTTLVVCRIA